jgi:hypothetical protein
MRVLLAVEEAGVPGLERLKELRQAWFKASITPALQKCLTVEVIERLSLEERQRLLDSKVTPTSSCESLRVVGAGGPDTTHSKWRGQQLLCIGMHLPCGLAMAAAQASQGWKG